MAKKYYKKYLIIICSLFFILPFFFLRMTKKTELLFTKQLIGNYQYRGEIKGVLTATFSKKNSQGSVEVSRGESKLGFNIPINNPVVKGEGGRILRPTDLSYTSDDKIIEVKYSLTADGLKEEIILNKIPQENKLPIQLKTENLTVKITPDGIPVFYSVIPSEAEGSYQFHFSRPFMKDGAGNVSYGVRYVFQNQKENQFQTKVGDNTRQTLLGTPVGWPNGLPAGDIQMLIELDSSWLHDPKRVLPITIDPTVVHDTQTEFATGSLNRSVDTGSGFATGGIITQSGGYTIHTFTGNDIFIPNGSRNVEILVVAGGGGGGVDSGIGGGGGGGGIQYNASYAVTPGNIPVTVGTGGIAGTTSVAPTSGNNSVFGTITATGGGYGGYNYAGGSGVGGNGGSGGGGAAYHTHAGGTGSQGYNGGNGGTNPNYGAGGGGGNSQLGSNGTANGGKGGDGTAYSTSGSSVTYSGGGGGGCSTGDQPGCTAGAGGTGGGGAGSINNGSAATAGTDGLGGGGGGGYPTGGKGGNGIVIIRYPSDAYPSITTNYQEFSTDINTFGLYHFSNSACTTDSSGNAYTLTANGGITCATGGMFGYKASGFATTPVSYSHTTILDRALPAGTIETWINPANLSAVQTILYSDSTSDTLLTLGTSGQINFSTSASTNLATANNVIAINTWTHVAAVWTAAGHKIYINGVETATDTNTTTHTSQDYTTYVGVGAGGNTLPFSGSVDELRISSIARTPEEIKLDASRRPYSVYTSDVIDLTAVTSWTSLSWSELGVATGDGETLSSSTNLVAQWNFNETSGTTADNAETTADRDFTLNNFASTASQDQAAATGWTAANKRWGAGGIMLSSVATADTLSIANPGSNGLDPNSSDLSIEMWVKTNDVTAELLSNNSANGVACTSNGYYLGIDASGYPIFYLDSNGATAGCDVQISAPTTKINDGNWHLLTVSVTRGTSATMYLDGVNIGSDTSVTSYSAITVAGNVLVGSTNNFDGIIDSTRVYSRALTANEILSNYQAGNVELQTRVGTSTDANDGTWEAWKPTTGETAIASMDSDSANWVPDYGNSYSKILLHADGTDASTTFLDSSLSPHPFTANGNAQIDTAQSKFGSSSLYFDNATSYISTPSHLDYAISTKAFTFDFWLRSAGSDGYDTAVSFGGSNVIFGLGVDSAMKLYLYSGGGFRFAPTTVLTANTWYHIALVGNGGAAGSRNIKLYLNGTQEGSTWTTDYNWGQQIVWVGSNISASSEDFNGWIDEFRMSVNVARWSTNFTPSTSAYNPLTDSSEDRVMWTNMSNESTIKVEGSGSLKQIVGQPQADATTVGLWHLDETGGTGAYIKDSTANANHATPTGTSVINGFSGKARSFNGTSDVITRTSVTTYNTSRTVEFWFNPATTGGQRGIISVGNVWNDTGPQWLIVQTSGNLLSVFHGANYRNGTTVLAANQWYHGAYTFNSSNNAAALYLNGNLEYSGTVADYNGSNTNLYIGAGYNAYFSGKLDEIRISNVVRTAEEIAEAYRAGRDHYLNKTISSTDLSAKTSLPFYVASDRQGTFLQTMIGESSFANYLPDANTIGLWHLDEQSGSGAYIKDSSGNSNNGTPTGTTFTQGKIGKARYFSGSSDYIYTANSSANPQLFTLEAWFNTNTASGKNILGFENSQTGTGSTSHDRKIYIGTDGKAYFGVYDGGVKIVASTSTVTDSKWHYVVGVYNGSSVNLYLDGVFQGTLGSGAAANYTGYWRIGSYKNTGWTNGVDGYFTGYIDEVRISNSARTADQIRQAYEVGARTHNITVDFKAALNSGNLITGTSDLGFTIDATAYGASAMGSNLYLGDKIIVKENYDGTEYLAQGTVNTITVSTGAVTVTAWDSGSTVPSGGFTVNATVFKWQREYFDLQGSLSTHRDAITNITLRLMDGSQGSTVWLDDFRSSGGYLTTPGGSTITSSVGNRYFQYRVIPISYDPAVSASFTSVTLDYVSNSAPATPSLDLPTDTATNQSLLPIIKTTTTDADSDYLRYKIHLCTDSGMTANCQTFDQTASQTGWSGQNTEGNTAYTSGTQGIYTVQTALSASTVYYWKSYAIDPGGINAWSSTQGTPYSFTTTTTPSAPTTPYCEGSTNPTGILDTTPEFSAIHNDANSDAANYYQIEVNTQSDFLGTSMWDSTKTGMSNLASGVRSTDVSYGGTALTLTGSTYYWRIKFWDINGAAGAWSATQNFTMNNKPAIPSLDLPTDTATNQSLLPIIKTTTTDADADYLRYKIHLCTDSAMTANCQTFDQTASQTGWSGQNTQSNTAYTSGTQGIYTVQTALSASTVYYWKSYAIDPGGSNSWSSTQTTPYSFTTTTAPSAASACRIQESSDDTYLNIIWTDNATDEDRYEVQCSVDGGGWSVLQTNLAANTVSYQDSTVAQNHTYQYRIAPYFTGGPTYGSWCYTSTLNLSVGNFSVEGLKMEGVKLN